MAADKASEALLLTDSEGHYYVVPRELIESTKVSDDAKASVEKHLEGGKPGSAHHLAFGFSVVGPLKISHESELSSYDPKVGWPYYRPQAFELARVRGER